MFPKADATSAVSTWDNSNDAPHGNPPLSDILTPTGAATCEQVGSLSMETPRATPDDAGEVVAALEGLYRRRPPTVQAMAGTLSSDDFVLLLCTVEGRPVGFLQAELLDRLAGERMLLVYDVQVAPRERRHGVATQLMEAALDIARQASVARCWLITETENMPARSLYESLDGVSWSAVGFAWTYDHP